ncbi:hypothetical protein B0H17DRAFT_1136090 [Mycena rosella]|uniref:Uncharacterized protein n=1 Tax=Mycena rosella TaxID=1033263 RepID=A0AAD7DER7_MYCRO|nr:hypothetical protein B0H17DRAFT_1136090 [Mycena rosella]
MCSGFSVLCVFWGSSVVPSDSLGFGGRVKAAGNPESDRGGPGTGGPDTAEPVHKGRKGTANEPQSNPTERSSKSRRLVRGRVKRAEGPKQSAAKIGDKIVAIRLNGNYTTNKSTSPPAG